MRKVIEAIASTLWGLVKVAALLVGGWLFMTDIVIPLMLCDLHPDSCGEILERLEEQKRERFR